MSERYYYIIYIIRVKFEGKSVTCSCEKYDFNNKIIRDIKWNESRTRFLDKEKNAINFYDTVAELI